MTDKAIWSVLGLMGTRVTGKVKDAEVVRKPSSDYFWGKGGLGVFLFEP